eukprot:TRINITY_DN9762_c0_g1_i4.p1 TRINITY_DN9762_c0_g1~~TRINITY_DN9762_c0_g1_i4.p1  ORF type:complete len:515 (+),score=94.01 TRINITY_DN9762_c0_g1_i4:56-1600(+)
MEFGGYVEPPPHISLPKQAKPGLGRPAELRTVPDYDYSLFRYSSVALPWLFLIFLSGAVVLGLSFWQGVWGFERGQEGIRDGIPRDFQLTLHSSHEAGLKKSLRSLRCANFVIGIVPLLLCIFAIRAKMVPGALKGILGLCAFLFFCLFVTSAVSFGLGIDQIHKLADCPDFTFNTIHFSPLVTDLWDTSNICTRREQIAAAAVVADICQSLSALLLAALLVYTITEANWAWGPGKVDISKTLGQRSVESFPPPSPFTHMAETRRIYVWMAIAAVTVFVLTAFILTMKMHELRIKPRPVGTRNDRLQISGWPMRNSRFRVAVSGLLIAATLLSVLDMFIWRRRVMAYLLAALLFWVFVGYVIVFAMDVNSIDDAKTSEMKNSATMGCSSSNTAVPIKCTYHAFQGLAFMDLWTGLIVFLYLLYEFVYRVNSTWESFYFFADSEWLRNNSLPVESTDQEAFDWKRFYLDVGNREYYYSPSLGISCYQKPANFVEPNQEFETEAVPVPVPGAPVYA